MPKYTREAVAAILGNEELTPKQKEDKLFALYGQAISEGYVSVSEAQTATQTAIAQAKSEWEKGIKPVDVKTTDEYKAIEKEFADFKDMTAARTSEEYKGVKPKFFERVYSMIDRSEGAKPVAEQMAGIKKDFEEFFTPDTPPAAKLPQFGGSTSGTMPKGDEGAVAGFSKAWGFGPKKG